MYWSTEFTYWPPNFSVQL